MKNKDENDLSTFLQARIDELSKLSPEEQDRILGEEISEENIENLRSKLKEKNEKVPKGQYKNHYYRK